MRIAKMKICPDLKGRFGFFLIFLSGLGGGGLRRTPSLLYKGRNLSCDVRGAARAVAGSGSPGKLRLPGPKGPESSANSICPCRKLKLPLFGSSAFWFAGDERQSPIMSGNDVKITCLSKVRVFKFHSRRPRALRLFRE